MSAYEILTFVFALLCLVLAWRAHQWRQLYAREHLLRNDHCQRCLWHPARREVAP